MPRDLFGAISRPPASPGSRSRVTVPLSLGAHAIALRHGRDNRYHLFDPNYFHIVLKDKATFKTYVAWYLSQSNYDTQYTNKTGVVGIRPPM